MKKTEYVVIGLLAALLIPAILVLPGVLADETGTVTIYVNVSEASAITVSPNYLEFVQVKPGLFPFPASKQVDVTNTGSVNFTSLTVNIDSYSSESSNPYDTSGDPTAYSAGSFVVIYNSSEGDPYRFDNRMEWNYTKGWIAGMTGISSVKSWGWFYNHSASYIWNMANGTNGYCNESDATITIKKTTNPDSTSANRDMGTDVDSGSAGSQNGNWSTWTFASGSPWYNYCVATYVDCTKLMVYQFHPASYAAVGDTTLPACGTGRYLVQTSGISDSEFPAGDTESFNVTVYVPSAIPAGNVTYSTMTVTAA